MIIETDKGKVEGITRDGVTVFKGIPFAAPPVRELRWDRPHDTEEWPGVRKADTFGKASIQPVFPSMDGTEPVGEQSEDCLYLNVWTTGGGATARKPVMVWIHGGAFRIGSGSSKVYDGSSLAKRGAVVVTFNYRLGYLGFFAHPALDQTAPDGPANFGLLDQIKALQWVKDNIAQFGGNPGSVTIFGQSAGAVSVLSLFCSGEAANLFHRGIAQSAYAIPEASRDKALVIGAAAATRVFGLGDRPTLDQLRALPAEVFARTEFPNPGIPMPFPTLGPVVVVGDCVLRTGVRDTFEAGDQRHLPLILGSTSHEESILTAFGIDPAWVLAKIEEEEGPEAIEALKNLYRRDPELHIPEDIDNPTRFGGLVVRDFLFTAQARFIAHQHCPKAAARRYYHSYVPEQLRSSWRYGVPHGGELAFPFDSLGSVLTKDYRFTPADRQVASKISNYWLTFAEGGTPTGDVAWPKHERVFLDVRDWTLRLDDPCAQLQDFRITRLAKFAEMYKALIPIIGG